METIQTLLFQTLQMFALASIGFGLYKWGKITSEGCKTLGNLLIFLVLPCVIVNGFLVERTPERLMGLLLSAVSALIILLVSMLVSRLVFKKDAIGAFAAAFSNPGFFGVPLITALLSDGAVFYIAGFIGFLNLFQWSYGVAIMTGEKGRISLKNLLKAPFFLAIVVGLVFFLFGISMPLFPRKILGYITAMNTPLSMLVVGVYMAQTELLAMFRRKSIYLICLLRLIVIPLLALVYLKLLPVSFYEMKVALLIAAGCPVGTNIAVYAQLHGKDHAYAIQTVIVSTILSILTIPIIVSFV